jgi:hypothetical protein
MSVLDNLQTQQPQVSTFLDDCLNTLHLPPRRQGGKFASIEGLGLHQVHFELPSISDPLVLTFLFSNPSEVRSGHLDKPNP